MKPSLRTFVLLVLLVLAIVGFLRTLSAGPPSSPRSHASVAGFEIFETSREVPHTFTDKASLHNVRLVDPREVPLDRQLASWRRRLWVVSTKHLLCIAQVRGAACASRSEAVQKGVILGTFHPPSPRQPVPNEFQLQGLVPDSVTQVLLLIGNRERQLVDVSHNVFLLKREKPIHLIRLIRR